MNPIVKGGIALGVLCGVWMFVIGFTGWYKDPVMLNMFYLVVLIEIGVLVWALRQTAATRGFAGQVGAGVLLSLIGGVIIIGFSLLFTGVVFPDYFANLQAIQADSMRKQGMSETEISTMLAMTAGMQTPLMNALTGFFMTMLTGLVCSLIIGAFVRKK